MKPAVLHRELFSLHSLALYGTGEFLGCGCGYVCMSVQALCMCLICTCAYAHTHAHTHICMSAHAFKCRLCVCASLCACMWSCPAWVVVSMSLLLWCYCVFSVRVPVQPLTELKLCQPPLLPDTFCYCARLLAFLFLSCVQEGRSVLTVDRGYSTRDGK